MSIQYAYATAEVSIPYGSGVPGCEETNECFSPAEVTINVGEEVIWSNDDIAAHTVTSGSNADELDGIFDSGLFFAGSTFSWTAEAPGVYPYVCLTHSWQVGVVIVESESTPTRKSDSQEIVDPFGLFIPKWIRNNAGWWSDGAIDDSDFTSGIQFMIKENIISIPDLPEQTTETTQGVPDWVKNNAGWWAEGLIGDSDFISGIKYLVEQGIIRV